MHPASSNLFLTLTRLWAANCKGSRITLTRLQPGPKCLSDRYGIQMRRSPICSGLTHSRLKLQQGQGTDVLPNCNQTQVYLTAHRQSTPNCSPD
ncbi:hypothetical protein NDU88_005539 [Pleurodeles waltl]|uniref:Secreted protein n=1 Tax=Pleurodeles waltl TaxID=8319 RepID=A0AAV7LPG1_PLEWA|nr:hypothetical protein NDU88_005539 [Pleurodeles waltl]